MLDFLRTKKNGTQTCSIYVPLGAEGGIRTRATVFQYYSLSRGVSRYHKPTKYSIFQPIFRKMPLNTGVFFFCALCSVSIGYQ